VLGALVALPMLIYRMKAKRWTRLALDYHEESHDTELMILLPIWNESLVIEKKLDDLIRDYPFKTSLLVIDSASSDESVEKVNQWLSNNPSVFSDSQVIEMPERLGKTSAVKQALESLNQQSFSGLVLMTDADALITEGSIIRLHGWFSDSSIGAVGSRANRQTQLHGEKDYRSMYEMLRIAESKRDSTPFLEGSCMMWRHGAFLSDDLLANSNADDAQIASLIRINGLRSIIDENASFIDFAPTTMEGQSRQKIRRAQGLQNMLDRFPKQHKLPEGGYFSAIFRTQRYLHLVIPILLFQIAIVAIIRWTYVSVTSMPTGYEAVIHASLSFVELLILVSWLTFRNGIRLPLLTTIGALITSFEYLFIARYRNSRGISSHKWDQHIDVRQVMDKF
ncbi:MAG: glycosyltransferase, partial [Candidatus Thermoplasmatota archaeon]|nr:glycosyltransferase [Candidatus Thermoplasmatota archaeon]